MPSRHRRLQCRKLETPRYTVLRTLRGSPVSTFRQKPLAELRQYDSYLIAEVEILDAANMRQAANKGFRAVAGYIFGGNTAVHAGGWQVQCIGTIYGWLHNCLAVRAIEAQPTEWRCASGTSSNVAHLTNFQTIPI